MKRFNFSLRRLLELRKHREDEAKIDLGKAIGTLAVIEQRIDEVSMERARAMTDRYSHGMNNSQAALAAGTTPSLQNKAVGFDSQAASAASPTVSLQNKTVGLDFRSYDLYIRRLEQTTEKLQKEAVLAELEVNEKRDLFIEASRDRKVLDKVKERRQQEHRKEMFAEETKELDSQAAASGQSNRFLTEQGRRP
jgi:flagellar FliJ protein